MEQNYLEKLNEPQRLAVEATEGPVMVIAGAGSGKTRVLTYRIAHLLNKGVDAFNILSLTFTNKAAREMKERIGQVVGESNAKSLWMGTFHSVFARILRVEAPLLGYPSDFTIYDQQDAVSVMTKIINELHLDKDIYKPKQVLGRISQYKNNLITVRAYHNNQALIEADNEAMRPRMGDIYRAYVDRCFKSGAMDFDDLLLRTNEILTRFPEVLAKYQERFKYIMVDEYQDTNHSQYLIVKALASRYENLCVVGDDAQSIYAFRGANIRNILSFKSDYPDAKMYPLEQNYRSTQMIVEAANQIIKQNQDQLEKNVWTANETGEKIAIYRGLSDADEARFIATQIWERQINEHLQPKDFAILYRTNAQSRALEEALRKKGIQYRVYGGTSFYQRKEIKDMVGYMRLLINQNDEEALLRTINYPARGIGQTTISKLLVAADQHQMSLFSLIENIAMYAPTIGINAGTSNKLNDFVLMIKRFQVMLKSHDVYEVTMEMAKTTQLLNALKEDSTPEGVSRLENVQELLNSIQGYVEEQQQLDEGDASLGGFLENIALATDADNEEDDDNKVNLMTVHLAKGLEFPVVFIAGLEENLFPSMMSVNTRAELEEERRLFYVALTRAEKVAYMTYSVSRFRWGKIIDCEPSRFLEEIDDRFLEWKNLHISARASNNSGLSADLFGDEPTPQPYQQREKSVARQNPRARVESAQPRANFKPVNQTKSSGTSPANAQGLQIGQVVVHDRFGRGVVKDLQGEPSDMKAIIHFDNAGEKKLLLNFAKLKVIR
ncbi:UvrD-helicase domain-containing protein [Empedobacter falsenii]|uniref:DNA 3'-5' helicase n=1 Tax=Empedobacter falsenii TaxID=343874 RepID=A0ABY8V8I5_9FLAO|nr:MULTISPECIES: UvrD-helicase domain-containing protein [Empedobacter]MDM1523238.1 UvrD-helicase domain-containing protein [Empedobacter sp. 225-1]MDM1542485.1 UvrD-helicase domain-containing protein [Empedobacter sp. 189-2]WIH97637.1 UvrD-helicase domain-containing protein [Empedobacter falsenii]